MMTTKVLIEMYYVHANNGDWDKWCDLFADDMVMDEQLAGHIETLATLRPMMPSILITMTARSILTCWQTAFRI